jgi:hypothetical protein
VVRGGPGKAKGPVRRGIFILMSPVICKLSEVFIGGPYISLSQKI